MKNFNLEIDFTNIFPNDTILAEFHWKNVLLLKVLYKKISFSAVEHAMHNFKPWSERSS